MKSTRTSVAQIAILLSGLALVMGGGSVPATRAADSDPTVIYRGVSTAVRFDVSPPLAELARRQPTVALARAGDRSNDRPTGLEGPPGPQDVDALVQYQVGLGEMPAPSVSFDTLSSTGAVPPDPVGAVGPNHYVVMANVQYAVYSKAGTLLAGPANINTLWSGFGGACQNENAGDPIVLYDRQADRWLLTQFTANGPTYFNCVALSQTGDPTGAYYRWAFSTGTNFPDYPKYGHWPDAYYISTREFAGGTSFAGIGAYALNRTQMIAGNPAPQVISFLATPGTTPYRIGDGLLPTDLDGSTLPPAGTPNFYIGSQDDGGPYGAPSDALNIWKFHVDFVTPANSTFTGPTAVAVAAFDSMFPCSPGARDCIPQPGTRQKVDHQGYRQRVLHRAAYRNFGTHESIVTNQSVEASAGISGIRWWEIRSPNASPTVFQEGTYAPGVTDGIHRWMGSIAQDKQGNMALGFSASSTSVFPSVWYAGRLTGDAPGTMGRGELAFINGLGSQTSSSARWGDYTAMTVDPVDDCTFWYVNEYYPATSSTGWRLRVGAFAYPSCTVGGSFFDYTLANSGDITVSPGGSGATTITATLIAGPSQGVSFVASGLPTGATASFSPTACTPSCSTQLTISTSSSTPSGTFAITVTGNPLASMTVFNLVVSGGGCPVTTALQGAPGEQATLSVLYDFRDNVLGRTPAGQRYVEVFYERAAEGVWLMLRYPELRSGSRALIERFLPTLRAVLAGQPAALTAADLVSIDLLLRAFAAHAGPGLRADIHALQRDLRRGEILRDLGVTVRARAVMPRR